jgi:hypothetical protein
MTSPRPSMFMTRAGGEVAQFFFEAGGAAGVDAAPVDLAFFADEQSLAARAMGGEDDLGRRRAGGRVVDDGDDLGDDVAAALDLDEVADADAEAGDLVGVVQGGAGDGGAADEDGRERGDGGDLAGAADLEEDAFELGDAGARGELVGDGPARGLAGEAEAALLRGGVDFDDDAVDLVAERVAQALGAGDEGEDCVDGVDGGGVRVDAEAGGAQRASASVCVGSSISPGFVSFAVQQEVGVEVEAALGDDVGFERADGAGGGVARIDGGGETLRHALLVHLEEGGLRQDDLAADLEVPGQPRPSALPRRRAAARSGWCGRWR